MVQGNENIGGVRVEPDDCQMNPDGIVMRCVKLLDALCADSDVY